MSGEKKSRKRNDLLNFILQELVFLSNSDNIEDKKISIKKMLEAIQIYTNADRVYIFETLKTGDCFSNTYEYCKEGVIPQISALNNILAGDMPFWYQQFLEGKSIIISNIEEIKNATPHEYALLKSQDIKSEIAFPIFRTPILYGFFGVDNPDITKSQDLINLLGIIGGFLGSIFDSDGENGLFALNKKEKTKVHSIERDRLYLEILYQEYTSVLYLNLLTGKTDIVKKSPLSHMSKVLNDSRNEELDYMSIITNFSKQFLAKDIEKFCKEMSVNSIKEKVKENAHFAYRFETIPSTTGNKYFEVQVIKLTQDETEFGVILGFRYIDSIIEKEQQQQKQLEDALREAELNNEIISAISKIYFMIYRIDLDKNHYDEISSNTEVHRLTGKNGNAREKMFEICNRFVEKEYQDSVRRFFDLSTLKERLKEEDTIAIEYKAADGNWHLARFIAKKRNAEGEVTHVLYVTRLISSTKLREQNLILIAEEANRANEAKTEFLSRMAHDIRTPMNAISGFTQIAKANLSNEEKVEHCINQIEVSCKYLDEIVNDVLDLTRIEYDKETIHPATVNIKTEFAQLLDNIASGTTNKKLEFKYEMHDIFSEYVILDALHMKQIFSNLISNSIKYTQDGGTITFEIYEEKTKDPERLSLIVQVKDTGIGMDEEFMKKMYDKFTRAVDTRINNVRGSGLGLAVVKELVSLLHGTIEAKSKVGKGTTFSLTFPVFVAKKEEKQVEKRAHDLSLCKGMHLLIAEDNELNYEVAEGMLAMYGVTCSRAINGADCVEKIQQAKPSSYQGILMDMQMPVMSGVEATKMIRKLGTPFSKTIPIIGLTANAFESDVKECLDAGMNAHFSKPFDTEKLLETLIEIIKHQNTNE